MYASTYTNLLSSSLTALVSYLHRTYMYVRRWLKCTMAVLTLEMMAKKGSVLLHAFISNQKCFPLYSVLFSSTYLKWSTEHEDMRASVV